MDILGMGSYAVLGMGEWTDLAFAPLQYYWLQYAYGSTKMAALGGMEELLPFTDFIPSCTIIHFLESKGAKGEEQK